MFIFFSANRQIQPPSSAYTLLQQLLLMTTCFSCNPLLITQVKVNKDVVMLLLQNCVLNSIQPTDEAENLLIFHRKIRLLFPL